MNLSSLQNNFGWSNITWVALSSGVTGIALSPVTHAKISPRKWYLKYFSWLLDGCSITCKHSQAVLSNYLKQLSGLLLQLVQTFYLYQQILSYWSSQVVALDSENDFFNHLQSADIRNLTIPYQIVLLMSGPHKHGVVYIFC